MLEEHRVRDGINMNGSNVCVCMCTKYSEKNVEMTLLSQLFRKIYIYTYIILHKL